MYMVMKKRGVEWVLHGCLITGDKISEEDLKFALMNNLLEEEGNFRVMEWDDCEIRLQTVWSDAYAWKVDMKIQLKN